MLAGVMLAWGSCAWALDPALDVSQYAHTAWRIREGFTTGEITSVAQTPDGYLRLGTEFGLYRFDGVRASPWQPPAGQQLSSSAIHNLLVARDGTLWIGTLKSLASWKDGGLTQYPEVAGQGVGSLLQDREGTVWFRTYPPGKLCATQGGKVRCYRPMLRDEIYRIAREALINAFRHAKAQNIEAEITYGDSEFLLQVRDDGVGMAPQVANHGARAGHWGLPGMRERAKSLGGNLEVWSEQGAGTEIELTVSAAVRYGKSIARHKSWFLRKKN